MVLEIGIKQDKRGKRLFSLIITGLLLVSTIIVVFPGDVKGNRLEENNDESDLDVVNNLKDKKTLTSDNPNNKINYDGSSKWIKETLGTDISSWDSSITNDSYGNPHVCYISDSGHLIYTRWTGDTWTGPWIIDHGDCADPSIVLGKADTPMISYYDNGNLMYIHKDASGDWNEMPVDTQGDVGYGTSIALDWEGFPRISYTKDLSSGEYSLKYAIYDGFTWENITIRKDVVDKETSNTLLSGGPLVTCVVPSGTSDFECIGYFLFDEGEWTLETIGSDVGHYISDHEMTRNPLDKEEFYRPYVVFQNDHAGDPGTDIYVYKYTLAGFKKIDKFEDADSVSVALDRDLTPHLIYETGGSELTHAKFSGGEWIQEVIESQSEAYYHPSLTLDEGGNTHAVYWNYDGDIKYAVSGLPEHPQALQATAGNDYIDLYWDPPEDEGGRNVTDYKIYRGLSSGGKSHIDTVDDSNTRYTDSGLATGQKYFYNITAVNDIGESSPSNDANATTSAGNNPPAQPDNPFPEDGTHLTGRASSWHLLKVEVHDPENDSMNVHFWAKAADDGSYDHIDNVTVDPSEGEEWAVIAWSGLENNTEYKWWAVADDGANHTYSDVWTFYTDDAYESNDDIVQASDFTENETEWLSSIDGMGRHSDTDWYEVYVDVNAKHLVINATFDHYEGDIGLELYNSSGSLLASSDSWTDNETLHHLVNESQTNYYIKVSGEEAGNFYDLWWDDQSGPLPPNNPNPSLLEEVGTTDPTLSVDVQDGNEEKIDVKFYNASNDQLIDTATDVPHGETASVTWEDLNEGNIYGWYAVAEDEYYTAKSDYWIFSVNTPPDAPSNPTPADGSKSVSLNPTLEVDVHDPDDEVMDVVFYNYSGGFQDTIGTVKNVKSGENASVTWDGLAPSHTYQWVPKAVDGTNENLSPILEFTTDDAYEENDDMSTAYDISNNETEWLSTINSSGIQADDDWYEIYVDEGYEHLLVNCTFDNSQGNIDLALYKSNGSQLTTSTSTDDNEFIDYYVKSGDSYYLRVYSGDEGNSYDLRWNEVNDSPTAKDDYNSTEEDTTGWFDVLSNDTDVDGTLDASTVNVTSGPSHGSATVHINGSIEYSPNMDYSGSDGLTYTVDDNEGATSNEAMVSITVNEINEAPAAPANPSPSDGTTGLETSPTLSVEISDPDGDSMRVSFYDASDDSQIGSTQTGIADGGTASVTWSGLSNATTYDWYVVANDTELNTQSTTWSFTTQDPPEAEADADETTINVGDSLTLDASGSSDNDNIENYTWLIDGEEHYGEEVECVFDQEGDYTVELIVTDSAGNSDSDTIEITVEEKDSDEGGWLLYLLLIIAVIGVITAGIYWKMKGSSSDEESLVEEEIEQEDSNELE